MVQSSHAKCADIFFWWGETPSSLEQFWIGGRSLPVAPPPLANYTILQKRTQNPIAFIDDLEKNEPKLNPKTHKFITRFNAF
jgi:hypothetical protein